MDDSVLQTQSHAPDEDAAEGKVDGPYYEKGLKAGKEAAHNHQTDMDKTVWERLKNHKVEGKTEEEKASIEEAKKKDF